MGGIYIPNMEMPKTCFSCSFNDGLFCSLIDDDSDALLSDNPVEEISTRRLDACPIIDIVRCGECKYYFPYKNYDGRILGYHCQAPNQQTDFLEPTHYCGFGERRTDEHTD